ncbi:MAG TPA: hypothetical protein DIC30_00655 [Oceanospirillales bacterium]|nr:hypothetical protein [Oleispira sp.]HCM04495.1 hypothetical protein [Oceanospirillales bacterium]|tara:strand:+ start:1209 stop:2372 length:1164 start_codon:yes stop_codon:yes gene_type:complete
MHPLIADKTLVFSPALAATIGLEEAITLTWLNDIAQAMGGIQWHINNEQVRQVFPFWDDQKIRLALRSLHEKGLIQLISPLFPDAPQLIFCFPDQSRQAAQSIQQEPAQQPTFKQPMQQQWQPSRDGLNRLQQHGIPDSYSLSKLDEFILQARENGNNRNDWNTQFFRFIKKHWVYTQTDAHKKQQRIAEKASFSTHHTQAPDRQERFQARREEAGPIAQQWQPSLDAQQILQRAGIDAQFIQDSIPEFVLYWQERGDAHKTWNTKFIQHVRQQWARYSSSLEHSSMPTRISEEWQPANDCYDILAMAHIDVNYAKSLIGEFVLYWRDSNQLQTSWNSKFLQYVKQQWARQLNQGSQTGGNYAKSGTAQSGNSTASASLDQLLDNDW